MSRDAGHAATGRRARADRAARGRRDDPAGRLLARNVWLAVGALLAGTGTLVCCVLPAAMVAIGAGATLAAMVSAAPVLVWWSAHKALAFGGAALALAIAGRALWKARYAPCPSDPKLALACRRLRRASLALWCLAVLTIALGATFAFVLPALRTA